MKYQNIFIVNQVKATSDGSKKKDKVKWVVSVTPINGNELNMPNKAQRASISTGKNYKSILLLKKTNMEKKWTLKVENKELERGIPWNY